MKKRFRGLICFVFVFVFVVSAFQSTAFAESDFVIENGVLLEYKGSSTSVTIPSNVHSIADFAFSGNKNIKSVNLNNISHIGNEAFKNCTALTTVSGYDNVSSCGAYAFHSTPFLNNLSTSDLVMGSVLVLSKAKGAYTVPANIKSIAPYSFSGNTAITSVNITDGVSSVGEGAFYGCTALKTVTVSRQVTHIGAFAFENTAFLKANTQDFLILGNDILVKYFGDSIIPSVPENVKQIASGAFYGNKKITSVNLAANVSGIGMRAFSGCTELKKIDLPQSLILLDKEAFAGCTALESVSVPESVEIIGESVFIGCKKIKTVEYSSDADISRGLFADCTALTSVKISSQPEKIGELAFYNCSALSEISLPDTINSISVSAFSGADNASVWCDLSSYAANELKSRGVKVEQIGDANMDYILNIKDVTHIQKATAGLLTLNSSSVLRADSDFNGVVNVRDATWIQKKIAGII